MTSFVKGCLVGGAFCVIAFIAVEFAFALGATRPWREGGMLVAGMLIGSFCEKKWPT